MKVIIDTNVLVSAAIADRNPEVVILFMVGNPEIEWVVSAEILTEYKEVLNRRRLKLTPDQKQRWFTLLDEITQFIDVNIEIDFPRDQKDAKFIACAIAAAANFLITGDIDFSEVQTLGNTTIISVSLFKRLICDIQE